MTDVTFERIERSEEAIRQLEAVVPAYREVFAEPPYGEGPQDAVDFLLRARRHTTRDGFQLVLARAADELVGFSFGYWLPADTRWWSAVQEPLDEDFVKESGTKDVQRGRARGAQAVATAGHRCGIAPASDLGLGGRANHTHSAAGARGGACPGDVRRMGLSEPGPGPIRGYVPCLRCDGAVHALRQVDAVGRAVHAGSSVTPGRCWAERGCPTTAACPAHHFRGTGRRLMRHPPALLRRDGASPHVRSWPPSHPAPDGPQFCPGDH